MAHIDTIGASIYTSLWINAGTLTNEIFEGVPTRPANIGAFRAYFETANVSDVALPPTISPTSRNVGHIRELPSMGTPPNIVNVPQYGQATSSQIQAQADAPSLELQFNYVPSEHAYLDQLRKDGVGVVFRIRISNNPGVVGRSTDKYDDVYFYGTVASMEIAPSLSDSLQTTIALTIDGDFEGPFSEMGSGSSSDYGLPPVV